MRILYTVPYAPNLVRVRPYNLIRHLIQLGHEVVVATLFENDAERKDLQALTKAGCTVIAASLERKHIARNMVFALPSSEPLQYHYCWHWQLSAALAETVERDALRNDPFDVMHIEHLRGARYGIAAKQWNVRPPLVWDSVDCISHLFEQAAVNSTNWRSRMMTRFELARTRRVEGWLTREFDHVVTTSPTDAEALAQLAGQNRAPLTPLPNGVDTDYFQPEPSLVREPATIVVSGKMSYHANEAMALHLIQTVMPIVWETKPNTRVVVVGKDPTAAVVAYADHPLITVTGTVPDMRPYLQTATIAVAPIQYGAGIQNKLLEAMACATPVITTPAATAALRAVENEELLVAEAGAPFAEAITDLLSDAERQYTIGRSGLAYVQREHSWRRAAQRLVAVYEETGEGIRRNA